MTFLLFLVDFRSSLHARASSTVLQLSAWEPYQVFDSSYSVYGLRANLLHGNNEFIYGIDLGVANEIQRGSHGIQFGLVNLNRGYSFTLSTALYEFTAESQYGISVPLIARTKGNVNGLQIGLLYNTGKLFKWPQLGGWNESSASPLQIGWIANYSEHSVDLGQVSTVSNETLEHAPFQISSGWNQATRAGIQLAGLVNLAEDTSIQFGGLLNGARLGADLQIAGFSNVLKQPAYDPERPDSVEVPLAQISAFYNEAEQSHMQFGFFNRQRDFAWTQIGVVNVAGRGFFQAGLINVSDSGVLFKFALVNADRGGGPTIRFGVLNTGTGNRGIQVGIFNANLGHKGISIGLINAAIRLDGIQIGLLNVNGSGPIPLMPGINFGD